jgi:glutamate dehydrogenase
MRNDLTSLARELARSVLTGADVKADASALIDRWQAQREFKLARARQLLSDLQPLSSLDMAMLSVLLRELRALV